MKRKKITLMVSLLLLILFILFYPHKTALTFYKENTNDIAAYLPLKPGDQFDIVLTHSIHLTDVIEKYHVTEDLKIVQDEIIFESFGIGMPSNAEEGETFEYKDGKYHISNLSNLFESMNIRNGKTVSEHRLKWKYKHESEVNMIWFNEYFKPGAWYKVKVDKLPLWKYLKGVKIDE